MLSPVVMGVDLFAACTDYTVEKKKNVICYKQVIKENSGESDP